MLRLMTYNVHGCVGMDKKLDLGRIAGVIGQSRPDIVALQELDVGRARSGSVDQAHAIAAKLGMTVHFNAALSVEEEQYGDAILTALPEQLVKVGALPTLPNIPRNETRGALWVSIEVEGRQLQVINTHLGLVPHEQQRQAKCLVGEGWLGHPACLDPVVLLGDFNATSRYAAYKTLAGRLSDVQRVAGRRRGGRSVKTFPSRMPMLRIDHMFVSRSIEVLDVHAPDSALARIASDHLPLVVDIGFRA
ncbi:MAG: endonuclease/exonuclease/phosphatase family protein [Caulobacteraceae bacterium]